MTPSLQQAIKLLQMSKLELVDEITQELTVNPVLEESQEPREGEAPEPEVRTDEPSPRPRSRRRGSIRSRRSIISPTSRTISTRGTRPARPRRRSRPLPWRTRSPGLRTCPSTCSGSWR
jgi:DNA-directed RNA polymerase specialized sigma54-like protein